MAGDPVAEKAAACVLKRAVELDTAKRFTESLVCYQEGLQLLMEALKANGIFLYFFTINVWIFCLTILRLSFRTGRE